MGARTLVRPPRDLRVDVLRGWMQVSIFISHAVGTVFYWGIHAAWGLSDSSEQFVFLSGMTLGSVFTLKQHRDSFAFAWRDLLGRTARLWRIHLLVFALFGVLVMAAEYELGLVGEVARRGWSLFAESPWQALSGAALLLHQPMLMGVFPVFLLCMLALPGFVWALDRWGTRALAGPVALYVFAQVVGPVLPPLWQAEIEFDPFASQLLFMLGAWLGRAALLGEFSLPRHRGLIWAAAAVVLFGLWVRMVGHGILPGPAWEDALLAGKEHLALPRLLHALALAYLAAMLIPRSPGWMQSAPFQAMAAIGRNSLPVFSFGLFLSYLYTVVARLWPAAQPVLDVPMIALGVLALVGFARFLERRRPAPMGAPKPA